MAFAQLVASLLGVGIVGAKNSHDLKMKEQSARAQAGMAEYHHMYDPVPRRKGYCRVMEWDLIHKKIRDDHAEVMQYYDEADYHAQMTEWLWPAQWKKMKDESRDPYVVKNKWKTPEAELAARMGWWEWVKQNRPEYPDKIVLPEKVQEEVRRFKRGAVLMAQHRWFKAVHPEYQGKVPFYDYQKYVLEYARKTVYESGYIPSCQKIGKTHHWEFDTMYDGRLPGLGSDHWTAFGIDWAYGIPDQEKRKEVIEIDKKFPG